MDREQRRLLAECFIASVGLAPGQYEMEEQENNYWEFYIPRHLDPVYHLSRGRRRKFGSILGREDRQITIYATGDWHESDHQNRFTPQPSDERDGWIRLSLPDDGPIWNYATSVVRTAYLRAITPSHTRRPRNG